MPQICLHSTKLLAMHNGNVNFAARSTQVFGGDPLYFIGGRSSNGFRKLESGPRCHVLSELQGTEIGKGCKKSPNSRLKLAHSPVGLAKSVC
ncbi:hypothetical protein OUZ56_010670 [Daphnia magna]|uniref:Uncharacterized protein n=1 Tax=Daphnia magna TaxID=35525 RepID=A0ABR0AJ70_9CRUS|nr:hypothetical protein OUZ56_010670 [Daphnia magna]